MPFELDQQMLFYVLVAGAVVLAAEAIYLTSSSRASWRKTVNRRLRLMEKEPNHEAILAQIRRERGLTAGGLHALPVRWLNQLVLQSGATLGMAKLATLAGILGLSASGVVFALRGDAAEAAGAALFAGVVLPLFGLRTMRKRRQAKFGEQFPDALDIIVRSLRAGHPIPIAISMVSREMPDPVGGEFGIVSDEATYGSDMETAMRNLYFRVGQEDLPLFVTAVAIQASTGGNLAEILANLSAVIRMRFKMRRKIKALSSEAKFSAFFLSGLPIAMFLLLQFVAPDFYGSVIHLDMTQIGLAAAGGWMAIGNFLMYRMVNFRI